MAEVSDNTNSNISFGSMNFGEIFPPELSNILFSYLPDRDLFSSSQCCRLWRNLINNDQQWIKRCQKRGWAVTKNAVQQFTTSISHRPSVKKKQSGYISKNLKLHFNASTMISEDKASLPALCDWVIYYKRMLQLQHNWRKGNYVIHEMDLTERESDADSNIVSCSTYNGKYLVVGTTVGDIFFWNCTGQPELAHKVKRIPGNGEIKSLAFTSTHLVALYEAGIIHIFDEVFIDEEAFSLQNLKLVYLGKIFFEVNDHYENCSTIQIESWTGADIDLVSDSSGNLVNEKYQTYFASRLKTEKFPSGQQIMISTQDDVVIISGENEISYIILSIKNDFDTVVKILSPPEQKILKVFSCVDCIIFSTEVKEYNNMDAAVKYQLVMFDKTQIKKAVLTDNVPMVPAISFSVSNPMDELVCERVANNDVDDTDTATVAVLSNDGFIGAYCIIKDWIFTKNTGSLVENLTSSKEMLFYQECSDHLIVALTWFGELLYKISGHVGPIRRIRCVNEFIISGGAARELIVWDKLTGKRFHRVYHQPSHIVDLYASETCIVTVGKDDCPVLIGYL